MKEMSFMPPAVICWIAIIFISSVTAFKNNLSFVFMYRHKTEDSLGKKGFTLVGTRGRDENSNIKFLLKNILNFMLCGIFCFTVLSGVGAIADFMLIPIRYTAHQIQVFF